MRRVARTVYHSGMILVFVLVALAGFTQTRTFKNVVLNRVLADLHHEIEGTVSVESLEGNLVTGFRLVNVKGSSDGSTPVLVSRVDVNYDIVGLLLGSVRISNITFDGATLTFIRDNSGTWNVSHLLPAASADSLNSSTTVFMRHVLVRNAVVRVVDSLTLTGRGRATLPDSVFDPADLTITSLSILADVVIAPSGVKVQIDNLSGKMPWHDLNVQRVSGVVEIEDDRSAVRGLTVETDRSSFTVNASLGRGLSGIQSVGDLKGAELRVDLRASRLDLAELRQYAYPHAQFADRRIGLDVRAAGTIDRLTIDRLSLRAPRSVIQMRGTISHLDSPSALRLDVEGDETILNSEDIRQLLPGLAIPSWERFGTPTLFFSFDGSPSTFDASLSATSERGSIEAQAHIDITSRTSYKGFVTAEEFDIGGILGEGEELSRLNGRVEVDGSGTTIDDMFAVVKVEFDSSLVSGIHFGKSVVVLDAAGGMLTGHVTTRSDAGAANLSGQAVIRKNSFQSFKGQGDLVALDLSHFPGLKQFSSELNTAVSFGGIHGETVERDSVQLQLRPSRFTTYDVPPVQVAAKLERRESGRLLLVEAPQVTAKAEGQFSLSSLISSLESGVGMVDKHIRSTFGSVDSLRRSAAGMVRSSGDRSIVVLASDTSDITFSFDFRDIDPLSAILFLPFEGSAKGTMSVARRPGELRFLGDVRSDRFVIADEDLDIDARDVSLSVTARSLPGHGDSLRMHTSVSLSSSAMSVNSTILYESSARAELVDSAGSFSVKTVVDSTVGVAGGGALSFDGSYGIFNFDSLGLAANTYFAATSKPAEIRVGRDGFLFRDFILFSGLERTEVEGIFHPGGISDVRVSSKQLDMARLHEILARSPASTVAKRVGGIVDANLSLQGSLDHPNLALRAVGSGMSLDDVSFGRIAADMAYFEGLLTLDVKVGESTEGDTQTPPKLSVRGTVPYALSLVGEPADSLEGEIDLVVLSPAPGLELKFLDPFLIGVAQSREGRITCDVRMSGDVDHPQYEGLAVIQGARLMFEPNHVEYWIDGQLVPRGDRVYLENVEIRNLDNDLTNSGMRASGSLQLEGLSISGFQLGFAGILRVLKEETSRTPDAKYYGDLTVTTGSQGLAWSGNPDRSLVTGIAGLRNTNITLPPERESVQYSARLIDVIHTIRKQQTSEATLPALSTVDRALPDKSFVDRIDFDLLLETEGTTQVRFVFDRQANDILFADLRGRLAFQRTEESTRLSGEVDVTERSYYNFLKRFSASGKMLFTGDPLNPELNIVAKYTGMHRVQSNSGDLQTGGSSAEGTREEPTTVTLYLTGPRNKLTTGFDVSTQKQDGTIEEKKGDVEADAIAFIMTNQFRDELTEQQKAGLLGENLGFGIASGLLTGPLSEALRRSTKGGVQSVDVIYYGNVGSSSTGTDLRVSGQLGDAIYRIGGRVFDGIASTNVVIELPMSWVLNSQELRNLILTLEKRGQGPENIEDPFRAEAEARLMYRISF